MRTLIDTILYSLATVVVLACIASTAFVVVYLFNFVLTVVVN